MTSGIWRILKNLKTIYISFCRYENWREVTRLLLREEVPIKIVLRGGIRIEAYPDSHLCNLVEEIFFNGVYTPGEFTLDRQDVVVDIGANIGVFTMFAAARTENAVYAFEPDPENVELLKQNARSNNYHHVKIFQSAVSDQVGTVKLYLDKNKGGHLLFDRNVMGKLKDFIDVPSTTIERIMEENKMDRIDFLKLDCEGSEGSILLSTPKRYLERIEKIAVEFHDNVSCLEHDEILDLLGETGFDTSLDWDGKSPFGYIYGARRKYVHPENAHADHFNYRPKRRSGIYRNIQ